MTTHCPTCHTELEAPDDIFGQKVQCTECGQKFIIEQPQITQPLKKVERRNNQHPTVRPNRAPAYTEEPAAEDFGPFAGRMRRRTYWLLMTVFFGVVFTLLMFHYGSDAFARGDFPQVGDINFFLKIICGVVCTILGVKRLHDVGYSGWWYTLWIVTVLPKPSDPHLAGLLMGLNLIVGLAGFIVLGFFRGTRGTNAYGPDPRMS